jgi:hypothetical protein
VFNAVLCSLRAVDLAIRKRGRIPFRSPVRPALLFMTKKKAFFAVKNFSSGGIFLDTLFFAVDHIYGINMEQL